MHTRNTAEDVADYIRTHNCGTIVGVDEAGRGCWAGPIVAAAAAVPTSWRPPPDVTDSKKLSREKMFEIYERYKEHDQIVIGIGVVMPSEIDDIGIDRAQALAQGKAIRGTFYRLVYSPFVVVDGINPPAVDSTDVEKVMLVPKADALIPAVSLASIFAKVTQLDMMRMFEAQFPGYGFGAHAGYGTKIHQAALKKLGPCQIHRQSYRPVREAMKGLPDLEGQHVDDLDALLEELME